MDHRRCLPADEKASAIAGGDDGPWTPAGAKPSAIVTGSALRRIWRRLAGGDDGGRGNSE